MMMNEKTYTGTINQKTLALATQHNVVFDLPKTRTITLHMPENNICPDVYGISVGLEDPVTHEIISRLPNDDDASLLKKYIDIGLVTSGYRTQISDEKEFINTKFFYIMYDIAESTANLPTYKDNDEDVLPFYGHYECQYEITLAFNDCTRRMVFSSESETGSIWDWIDEFVDNIDNLKDNLDDENLKEYTDQIYVNEYGNICFTMFDSVGYPVEKQFDNSFKSHIICTRVLKRQYIEK